MNVILAPHPDDELLGCWTPLSKGEIYAVVYFFDFDEPIKSVRTRKDEAIHCSEFFGFKPFFFTEENSSSISLALQSAEKVYLPSLSDSHPQHVHIHQKFRRVANKVYYSVDLDRLPNKRYLGTSDSINKLNALNLLYPSQSALWENNHSYFLFENLETQGYREIYSQALTLSGNVYLELVIKSDLKVCLNPLTVLNPLELSSLDDESYVVSTIIDYMVSNGCRTVEVTSCINGIYRTWTL